MLSVFPQILYLTPFSSTLLRLAAGLVFLYLAYSHWNNRREMARELSSLIGGATIMCAIYALLELLIAVGLIFGFLTQLAALIGFVFAVKLLLIRKTMHGLKPLSELSYALVAVMCLCLIISGAGPLGFDLPL